jgi:hypothetical protein
MCAREIVKLEVVVSYVAEPGKGLLSHVVLAQWQGGVVQSFFLNLTIATHNVILFKTIQLKCSSP